jgi:hypothetical protein
MLVVLGMMHHSFELSGDEQITHDSPVAVSSSMMLAARSGVPFTIS